MGSLYLLQGIFPTQGLNRDLLHCRWILYQPFIKAEPQRLKFRALPPGWVKLNPGFTIYYLCDMVELFIPQGFQSFPHEMRTITVYTHMQLLFLGSFSLVSTANGPHPTFNGLLPMSHPHVLVFLWLYPCSIY